MIPLLTDMFSKLGDIYTLETNNLGDFSIGLMGDMQTLRVKRRISYQVIAQETLFMVIL